MRKQQQQESEDTDIEIRARLERVLGMARVFFAIATLVAIAIAPDELSSNASVAYELLAAYVSFSAIVLIVDRLAPSYALKARFAIHLVDLLFATAITFLTRGSSSPFFVFFVFVLFAAPVRWGLTATLATGGVAIVLFLAEAHLAPPASPGGLGLEVTRTVMRTSYLVVLTLMLAFTAAQDRVFRAESDAAFPGARRHRHRVIFLRRCAPVHRRVPLTCRILSGRVSRRERSHPAPVSLEGKPAEGRRQDDPRAGGSGARRSTDLLRATNA